jgi:hypothetical protein
MIENRRIAGLTPKFEFLKFKLHNYWEFKFYQPGPLASGN